MVALAPGARLASTQEPSLPGVGVCTPVLRLNLTVTVQAPLIDAKLSRLTPAPSLVSGLIWTLGAAHGPRFLMVPTTEMVAPRLAVAGAVEVTSMSAYGFTWRVTAGVAVTLSPTSVVAWTVTFPRSAVGQEVGTGAVGSKSRATVMVAVTFVPNTPGAGVATKANGSLMVQVGWALLGSKPLGRVQPPTADEVTETKSTPLGSVKFKVSVPGRTSSGFERKTVTVMSVVPFGSRLSVWDVVGLPLASLPSISSLTAKPGVTATAANPVRATKRHAAAAISDFEKPARALWAAPLLYVPSVRVQPSLNRDRFPTAPRRPKHCGGIQVSRTLGGRIYQPSHSIASAGPLVSTGAASVLQSPRPARRGGAPLPRSAAIRDLAGRKRRSRQNGADTSFRPDPPMDRGRARQGGRGLWLCKTQRHLKGELVFCAEGGAWKENECKWPMWRACKKAGLRNISWHVLRHTFTSHLVMKGVPLKAVQELMGHATIEMTLRYSDLSPEGRTRCGAAARSAWQFHGNGHHSVGQLAETRGENRDASISDDAARRLGSVGRRSLRQARRRWKSSTAVR